MSIDELKEQIQNDICIYAEGLSQEFIDQLCTIVINNFNKYDQARKLS